MAYADLSKEERYARINKAYIKPGSPRTDVQKRVDEAKKRKQQKDMEVRRQNGTPSSSSSAPAVSTPLLNQSKSQPIKQDSKASVSNALADVLTPAERNKRDEWEILGNSNYTGEVDDIVQQDYERYGVKNAEEYRKVSDTLGDSLLSGAVDATRNTVNKLGYDEQLTGKRAYVSGKMDMLAFGNEEANKEADRLYAEYKKNNPNGEASRESVYSDAMNKEYEEKNGPTELYDIANFGKKYSEETQKKVAQLNENAQKDAQFYSTVGNMLPYIAISAATSGAGAATGIKAITTAGKVLSSSQMYLSAAGQATNEALKNGASAENAVRYGNAVGAIELGTEALFAGLGKGVGAVFGDVGMVDKLLGKAQKSMGPGAYKALSYVVDVAGEGLEELISEWGDYAAARIIDAGIDPRTVSEVNADAWESFASGAMLSFFMQTSSLMSQGIPMQEAVQQATEQSVEENLPQITNAEESARTAQSVENAPQNASAEASPVSKSEQAQENPQNVSNSEQNALADTLAPNVDSNANSEASVNPLADTLAPDADSNAEQTDGNSPVKFAKADEEQFWRDASSKPEVTGYDFSFRAEEIADFVAGLEDIDGEWFATSNFSDYVGKMALAYKINNHYPAGFTVVNKMGLHGIEATSEELSRFLEFLREKNSEGVQSVESKTKSQKNDLADTLSTASDSNANSNPLADTLTNTQRGTTENGSQYSITPNPDGTYNVSVTLPDGSTFTRNTFNPMEEIEDITWDSTSAEEYGTEFDEDVPIDEEFEAEPQTPSPQYAPQNRLEYRSEYDAYPEQRSANTASESPSESRSGATYHPINEESAARAKENYGRDKVQIPTVNSDGKLTSKTASTLANAGITTNELAEAIQKDISEGGMSRIAYSDDAAQAKAEAKISDVGFDGALALYKRYVASGKSSKDITALGVSLYNYAVTNGDASAYEIASMITENAKSTAQALQAVNLINKATPAGRLYMTVKSIERLEANLKEKFKKFGGFDIDQGLLQAYHDALVSGDEDAIKASADALNKSIGQQIPASFADKMNAWRYMAMLLNPRTHSRNIFGNLGFAPVRAAKNVVAYGLESVLSKTAYKGMEKHRAVIDLTNAEDRQLLAIGKADYDNVSDAIASGGKFNDNDVDINKYQKIFKSKILEELRRVNGIALDAEDVFFSSRVYATSLAQYLKANGFTAADFTNGRMSAKDIARAREVAIKEAARATYHDASALAEFINNTSKDLKNYANSDKAGHQFAKAFDLFAEAVLPFKKTPANILNTAFRYSPAGLVQGIAEMTRGVKSGKVSAADAIDTFASGLTGTALMGIGALLVKNGLLRVPDDDDKLEAFDKLRGMQDYALIVGDKNYSVEFLAPGAMPLLVGARMYQQMGNDVDLKDFLSAMSSIADPLIEMSMLQSLNDLIESQSYADGNAILSFVTSAASSYLSQYVPTILGQAERTFFEDTRNTTFLDKNNPNLTSNAQYGIGKVFNKEIVGNILEEVTGDDKFSDPNEIPYIDAWGRTQSTGNLGERAFNNFVNPTYSSEDRSTPVDDELERLYRAGQKSVLPSKVSFSETVNVYDKDGFSTEERPLTKDEYVKYSTVKGQTSLKMIQDLMDSDAYKSMSDDAKAQAVSDIYSYAKHTAASAVEKSTPEDKLDAIKTQEGRVNFIMVNNLTSSRNDKNRDYEAIDNGIKLYNASGKDVQNAFGSDFNKLSDAARHHIGSQEYYSVMDNTPKSPKMAEELTAINRYASNAHKAWFVRNILSTQTRQKDGTTQRQRFDKALKEGCTTDDIIAALMAYQNKTTGQLTGKAKTAYLVIYK